MYRRGLMVLAWNVADHRRSGVWGRRDLPEGRSGEVCAETMDVRPHWEFQGSCIVEMY